MAAHLKLTYITLYALAWRTNHETVLQSMAQLTELFSQLEGHPLTERGMRKRMTELAKLGLVKRIFAGGRWMTVLLLSHQDQAALGGTGSATLALEGVTSIEEDDDETNIFTYHHQSSGSGTTGATPATTGDPERDLIRQELWSMGIDEPVATELALMEHVTSSYIDGWAAYLGYQAAEGKRFGAGWLVRQMRVGRPAPVAVARRETQK